MKKGFTLIELLIVMVVVGLLVTVALPTYKTAMEKGRGLEGVANAAAVSEAVNAYYIRNGNSYGTSSDLENFVFGSTDDGGVAGITKSKYFMKPVISWSSSSVTVQVQRDSSNSYTITFKSQDGRVTERSCSGSTPTGSKYCKAIGF